MTQGSDQAIHFYTRHPISLGIVLARLQKTRGGLDGLQPSDLWAHDQDHFGGLAANDRLAERAAIGAGSRVAISALASEAQHGITRKFTART